MYQTDVLEILDILTTLGYKDERMQEAVDLVVSKQDDHGRWSLENTFQWALSNKHRTKRQTKQMDYPKCTKSLEKILQLTNFLCKFQISKYLSISSLD